MTFTTWIIVYCLFITKICYMIFGLAAVLPDSVLKWLGGGLHSSDWGENSTAQQSLSGGGAHASSSGGGGNNRSNGGGNNDSTDGGANDSTGGGGGSTGGGGGSTGGGGGSTGGGGGSTGGGGSGNATKSISLSKSAQQYSNDGGRLNQDGKTFSTKEGLRETATQGSSGQLSQLSGKVVGAAITGGAIGMTRGLAKSAVSLSKDVAQQKGVGNKLKAVGSGMKQSLSNIGSSTKQNAQMATRFATNQHLSPNHLHKSKGIINQMRQEKDS